MTINDSDYIIVHAHDGILLPDGQLLQVAVPFELTIAYVPSVHDLHSDAISHTCMVMWSILIHVKRFDVTNKCDRLMKAMHGMWCASASRWMVMISILLPAMVSENEAPSHAIHDVRDDILAVCIGHAIHCDWPDNDA